MATLYVIILIYIWIQSLYAFNHGILKINNDLQGTYVHLTGYTVLRVEHSSRIQVICLGLHLDKDAIPDIHTFVFLHPSVPLI